MIQTDICIIRECLETVIMGGGGMDFIRFLLKLAKVIYVPLTVVVIILCLVLPMSLNLMVSAQLSIFGVFMLTALGLLYLNGIILVIKSIKKRKGFWVVSLLAGLLIIISAYHVLSFYMRMVSP